MAHIEHLHVCTRPVTQPFGLARVRHIVAVWRSRRALAALDCAALRDIGVSRAAAKAEASRPIWDAPSTWLR